MRDSSADQHDVPLQLRLEVKVFNRDPQGSAPMEFQVRRCWVTVVSVDGCCSVCVSTVVVVDG